MCALNKVGARLSATIPTGGGTIAKAYEGIAGNVFVVGEFRGEAHGGDWREFYEDQSAFVSAYGLNADVAA